MERIADAANRQISANTIPDRVCVDKTSPYFWPRCTDLGVVFNGAERQDDVQEFCVSEGWIIVRKRSPGGRYLIDNETGTWVTEKMEGEVKPYLKVVIPIRGLTEADAARIKAAEEKRARKAKLFGRKK